MNGSIDTQAKQFEMVRAALPGAGTDWLDRLRAASIARFGEVGLPTPRVEAWKYTNLARLARAEFAELATPSAIAAATLAPHLMTPGSRHLIVFVDGWYSPQHSDVGALPPGAELKPLAELLATDPDSLREALAGPSDGPGEGPLALNAALMRDGMVLRIADGVVVERPVHLVFYGAAPAAVHLRNLVTVGANSRVTLIESYAGASGTTYWTNSVTDVTLGPGAALDHVRLQREGTAAFHTGLLRTAIDRDATYSGVVLSTGAALARNEFRLTLTGPGSECRLAGGALVRGRQHGDITTEVVHDAPHSASRQLVKNVLDDRSRTVFQGRVVVRPDAQKIDADQSNRNLLLSAEAQADSKPELRIFADDVKCSHGATVGDLDRDALFYLRSRGIEESQARAMLVRAFVAELVEHVEALEVRALVETALADWLGEVEPARAAA